MIRVEHLYKVFGKKAHQALRLLEDGLSRDEILVQSGQVVALDDVSFSVEKGEIFVVMGLSGSGKSTLIRCINRLVEPTKGNIFVENADIIQMNKKTLMNFRRKKMGMIFQGFAILPFRNVFDNVKFGLEVRGEKPKVIEERVTDTLKLVGLENWKDKFPDELSGGMQQRVGTARALVNDPDILLMDEPFSALDPLIRSNMQDELIELQKRVAKTIIFITHDLNEALKIGDRCAILKDGKVIQVGTGLDILNNPNSKYVVDFIREINPFNVLTAQDIMIDSAICVIDSESDTLGGALEKMTTHGMDYICVINHSDLRGVLSIDDIKRGIHVNKLSLNELAVTEIPNENFISHDTIIKDLCPVMHKSDLPIVVIDQQRILGIITPKSFFRALTTKKLECPENQQQ